MADEPKAEKYWVFVGTGGGKVAKGIYRFEFDPATGKLTNGELAAEASNPGFLAIHPNGKFLYAVADIGATRRRLAACSPSPSIQKPAN